jgi:hypothetical protein
MSTSQRLAQFQQPITMRVVSHTAAPQAYRAYSGNFRRLTDIVRCCLVVDTPEDLLKLVQVRCQRQQGASAFVCTRE